MVGRIATGELEDVLTEDGKWFADLHKKRNAEISN
jgi:hypothetical protein